MQSLFLARHLGDTIVSFDTEEGTRSSHLAPCSVSLSAKSEIAVRHGPPLQFTSEFIAADRPHLADVSIFSNDPFEGPEQRFSQLVVVGELDAYSPRRAAFTMFLPLLCAGRSLFPPTPHATWRAGYQTRLRRRDKMSPYC